MGHAFGEVFAPQTLNQGVIGGFGGFGQALKLSFIEL
jgi:hypothetical protein